MARPAKQGLDYFPLDVTLDDKFSIIEAEHGLMGFAIVIKLLQKIYSEGYFYEWGEMQQILFSKSVSVDRNEVSSIVTSCVKWGIFSSDKLDNYGVLTSAGIQKRYIEAVSRRSEVFMDENLLLIEVRGTRNITLENIIECVNHNSSGVNVSINPSSSVINEDINSQSKVKESKVKESKETETRELTPDQENMKKLMSCYIENINQVPSAIEVNYIKRHVEDGRDLDLLVAAIETASLNNARNLRYIQAIVRNSEKEGIFTGEQFRARKKQNTRRKESTKLEVDMNDPDYYGTEPDFADELMAAMKAKGATT